MKSTEYIINKLEDTLKKFPKIKIRYEYDSFSDTHYIEISPQKEYELREFARYEVGFISEFIEEYPYESVVFFTPSDKILKITNPIWEDEGREYMPEWQNEFTNEARKTVAMAIVFTIFFLVLAWLTRKEKQAGEPKEQGELLADTEVMMQYPKAA